MLENVIQVFPEYMESVILLWFPLFIGGLAGYAYCHEKRGHCPVPVCEPGDIVVIRKGEHIGEKGMVTRTAVVIEQNYSLIGENRYPAKRITYEILLNGFGNLDILLHDNTENSDTEYINISEDAVKKIVV